MLCFSALRWPRCCPRCAVRARQTHSRRTDPYAVLGIGVHSTAAEVKAQYYRICRQLHPDAHAGRQTQVPSLLLGVGQAQWGAMDMEQRQTAVHERFLAAREAYEVLADPAARNRYHASRRNQNQPVAHTVDPWAAERPRPGPPQTPAEAQYERAARWGLLGFIGVLLLVAGAQQQLAYEEYLQRQGAEHLLSVRLLATARERALERWREVPPGRIREFEARRLRSAPTLAAGQLVNDDGSPAVRQGEFHKLWPHGAGLGLLALLRDSQLCGLESRYRIATDPALADARPAARRALAQDRVVAKYID